MSYSMKRMDDDQFHFPPPPLWLTWVESGRWDANLQRTVSEDGKGQVRHLESLTKAKKYLSGYVDRGGGQFTSTWSVYEWTGEKYELRYHGERGDTRSTNSLYRTPLRKDAGKTERVAASDEVAEAIRSIVGAA